MSRNSVPRADYYLGCDVSKSKIDVALVDHQGAALWTDKVPNAPVAVLTYLLTLTGMYPDQVICCVVESTSTYHHTVLNATSTLSIHCVLYNPILTKRAIATSIRGKKTDKTDALLIARIPLREDDVRLYVPEPYLTTKYAARAQQQRSVFAGSAQRYQKHVEGVLEDALTANARALLDGIQAQFRAAKRQFVADTAASAPQGLMRCLQTAPGVGPYIAASFIGEIQDMRRFSTGHKLTAFVGLDPKIRQSGSSLNSKGKLTKRGSSYLRRSLFIAANVARQHDPYFKALYDKKRSEGKTYTVAICVVARKLLCVMRAMWLTETDYNISFWQTTENSE